MLNYKFTKLFKINKKKTHVSNNNEKKIPGDFK